MGKKYTTRHKSRRKFEQVIDHLSKASLHIAQVAEWYEESAGPPYDLMLSAGVIIDEVVNLVSALRERV